MNAPIQAFRLETALKRNGTLTLDDLPFQAGECVEVIVLPKTDNTDKDATYTLRGFPVTYDRPYDSVAANDWGASQ